MKKTSIKDVHDIQLKSIRVVSLNCAVNADYDKIEKDSLSIETSIGNYGEVLNDYKGKTYLKTKIEATMEDEIIFEIELVYEGICKSFKKVDKDEFEFFLELQSIPMLWSYSRETINNMMLKMNLQPILLPVLNITEIMKEMEKSKDGVGGEE